MNIEVRNIQYSAALSEETMAYTADIYVDGKRLGDARNRGHGGGTIINPDLLRQRIDEYAKALPDIVSTLDKGEPFTYRPSAETIIDELVSTELNRRDFRKMVNRAVLFTKADGKLYEIAARSGEDVSALAQWFAARKDTGAAYILNLMGEDEAFKIFEKAALT